MSGPKKMKDEPTWVDLADELEKIKAVQPLRADWFAYVGSEDYGIWLLHPDGRNTDGLRATFSLIAAHAIRKLGIPPIPVPEPLQHCPHWTVYCNLEEDLARREGKELDLSHAVPYGLSKVDLDAVDPCARAFLELLRRESRAFRVSSNGTDIIKGTAYPTIDGRIDDLCGTAATYCTRRARDEIGAQLGSRSESEVVGAPNSAGPGAEQAAASASERNQGIAPSSDSTANDPDQPTGDGTKHLPMLNVEFIKAWMNEEGWTNETLAQKLDISERAISSIRNNGEYHGLDAVTKLANLMGRDPGDLYVTPEAAT